jgi:hypothetical protein
LANNERRSRQRFGVQGLSVVLQPLRFFGFAKKAFPVEASSFTLGGLSFSSACKLKLGQAVLLEIANQDHRLQAIPAIILRMELQDKSYRYAVKFNLGRLSDNARKAAYAALLHIEMNLTPTQKVA